MPLYRYSSGGGSTIGGSVSGGAAGRIVYEAAGPVLADSANLQYSATGNLGLSAGASTPSYGFHQYGGGARIQATASPSAPTITSAVPGAVTYRYSLVAIDRNGNKTLAGPEATITTGGVPISTATNTVTWSAVPGAVSYDILSRPYATPPQITATVVGSTGTGSVYNYYLIANGENGIKTSIGPVRTITGNPTLDGSNYNSLSWTAVPGASSYDILGNDSAHSVTTGITTTVYNDQSNTRPAYSYTPQVAKSVALAQTGTSYVDSTGVGTTYTTPARNATADVVIDGSISSPGTGTGSEHFGLASVASNTQSSAFGPSANATGSKGTALGYGSNAIGDQSISIGANSQANGANSTAVGYGAIANSSSNAIFGYNASAGTACTFSTVLGASASVVNTATSSIAIGASAIVTNFVSSIVIGRTATATAANQLVIGGLSTGGANTYGITYACIGHGVSDTTAATTVTLTTTCGAVGTNDVSGGNLIIAGGNSTGTGDGGYVKFQTATKAAGTATSANTLTDRLLLDQYGNVILAPSGAALLTTAINGFTYIPTCAGTAAGTPAVTQTGAAPMVYDTTANKLWIYNPTGTPGWKFAQFGV